MNDAADDLDRRLDGLGRRLGHLGAVPPVAAIRSRHRRRRAGRAAAGLALGCACLVAGALVTLPGAAPAPAAGPGVTTPAGTSPPIPPAAPLSPEPTTSRPAPTGSPTPAGSAGTRPPAAAAPACKGDLLDADFEAGDLSEFDGREAQQQELQVVPDPAGGPGRAVRVEVRADQYGQGGEKWRAELVREGAGGANQDRDRCFAFATYLPADWAPEKPSMLFNVHERPSACEEGRSPPLTLVVDGGTMAWGTRWDSKPCSAGNVPEGAREIVAMPVRRGTWTRWTVRVRWSYGADGRIEIWSGGTKVADHRGPNCYNDDREMYLKVGNNSYEGLGTLDRHLTHVDDVRMGTT